MLKKGYAGVKKEDSQRVDKELNRHHKFMRAGSWDKLVFGLT